MAVTKENIATKKNAKNKLTQNNINTTNSKGSRSPSGHPKMMVYPTARGTKNITGDSLLIKCLEYIPPQTTSQAKYIDYNLQKKKVKQVILIITKMIS